MVDLTGGVRSKLRLSQPSLGSNALGLSGVVARGLIVGVVRLLVLVGCSEVPDSSIDEDMGDELPNDEDTAVLAALTAARASSPRYESTELLASDPHRALVDRGQVFLPTNNALSPVGHVHWYLEELGQGVQVRAPPPVTQPATARAPGVQPRPRPSHPRPKSSTAPLARPASLAP